MTDSDDLEPASQADAFTMLSDSTRLAIIEALWKAEGHAATFSELREAVGMRDSGQFNYHLGKLTDQFVAKRDDEYHLRLAGIQVVGSILGGAYASGDDVDEVPMDDPCSFCGGSLTFSYRDEWVMVACADCENASRFPVPPGVFGEYDREEYPEIAQRYAKNTVSGARRGFCSYCEGPVEPTVRRLDDEEAADLPERFREIPFVQLSCSRCEQGNLVDLGVGLHDHPAVVSFFHDHGIDVEERSFWSFSAVTEDQSAVESTDPFRATVTYDADGDRVTLTVDESLTVLDVQRSDE